MSTIVTSASSVDVAVSFFNAYDRHDVGKMLAHCADDARLRYVPMGSQGEGRVRDAGKKIWSSLIDAFPDLRVRVLSAFGAANNVAAEVMIGGTQKKDFLQIPNQGRHYDLPHAFLFNLNDGGLITEIAAYWDNASFFSQLGKKTLD